MKKIRKRLSKLSVPKMGRKIWLMCKALTRKIHGSDCYTCDAKNLEGKNWHTGHLLPKSICGAYLKYDLRVLRPQCARCNIWGGGMGATFVKNMIIREGQEYVDQIFRDKSLIVKERDYFPMLLEKYKLMLEEHHTK